MAPTPCAPSSDRADRRSAAPDDRAEPPCRDQTNRKIVLARLPADPSCAAPADALSTNGITDRESSQREFCNTIEGQADLVRSSADFSFDPVRTFQPCVRFEISCRLF